MPTGVEIIAAERMRQVSEEGWTEEHDDIHRDEELACAACYYAMPEEIGDREEIGVRVTPIFFFPETWDLEWAKRTTPKDRIRDLAKAGALIAAEIDRLQRRTETGYGRSAI